MFKRRWPVLLGPPLLLLAVVLIAGAAQPGARAGKLVTVPRLTACATAAPVSLGTAHPGTWWKTTAELDAAGTMVGVRLFVGRGPTAAAVLGLPVESSVSGPIDGIVVVASDDGSRSQVRLLSVAARCTLVVDERADVVRGAIVDPTSGAVFAHVVARDTRADLGTYRISRTSDGASEARLVAPPLSGELAATVGTVFGNGLRLDRTGTHLAVQSCTDFGCLTRIFDLSNPLPAARVLRGSEQGPMLGFAGTELVTWAACVAYPCPVLAWDVATDRSRTLVDGADAAALTADGRRLVAMLAGAAGEVAIEVDTSSGRFAHLRGLPAGQRPLAMGPSALTGLEVADDEVAMAVPGADPTALRPDSAAQEALP